MSTDNLDNIDNKNNEELKSQTEMPEEVKHGEELHKITHLSGMYKDWFLDYASYVILERAVPHLFDGLKPV